MRIPYRLWAIFGAISSIIIATAFSSTCPDDEIIKPCKCSDVSGEIQIWCGYSDLNKLQTIFKSLSGKIKEIDELILENNVLPTITGELFSNFKFLRLMLRNNGLQTVTGDWLNGLEMNLKEIYIVEPQLESFPDECLSTLPKLEAITISTASLTKIPYIFGLSRLRYIQIEAKSMFEMIKDNFQGLPYLEQLHITSSPRLKTLHTDFLHDLPRLSILNFTDCGINTIQPRAFQRLPSLTEISFTGNKIKDATIVGMAIRDLQSISTIRLDNNLIDKLQEGTFVDIPSLRNLYLNDNDITHIKRAAFHRLPLLRSLQLSNNNIRAIHPESFLPIKENTMEELYISNNEIEHSVNIRVLLDALPRLRLLDISMNAIQDIPYGTLSGHLHLEMLRLEHNLIKTVAREAFSFMPSLRELKLANNSLTNNLETPYWNLPALKGLDLSQNKFEGLDRLLLSGLPSLRRLDISHNSIKIVDPMTFRNTNRLEHVNMSHNSIAVFSPFTFQSLQRIYELDISNNHLDQVATGIGKNIEYLFASNNQITKISSSDFQLPSLKLLDLSNNKIHQISGNSLQLLNNLRTLSLDGNSLLKLDETSFEGLTQLRELNMANNKIIMIHQDTFKQLKHLVGLNLKNNRLEILNSELLAQNTELKKLDISENKLSDIPLNAFIYNKKIEKLYLEKNSINDFPVAVSTMPFLQILDLSGNEMRRIPPNVLSFMSSLSELHLPENKLTTINTGTFEKLTNLTLLNLEKNEIEKLERNCLKFLPKLTVVKLSKNKLTNIPKSTFVNLPKLQAIELQFNQLTEIADEAFISCPNILMLNVSHNLLTTMDRAGFSQMKTLEALDLSHNRIRRFSTDLIKHMNFLVMLKVDNNRLCNIDGSPFEKMTRLRMLSFKDNKMTTLAENTFQKLRSTIIYLDIEGNPVKCSCSMLWLQSWIQQDEFRQPGPRCSDGTLLKDQGISLVNCEEEPLEIVPGCESAHAINQVSPTSKPNTNVSLYTQVTYRPISANANQPLLPLPEESDYFDPKFIDYHENISKNSTDYPNISSGVLSHYISGDTPTIYAGTRTRNDTSTTTEKTAGMSIFGLPIPSLNFGNLWSTTKYVDSPRKDAGRDQKFPSSNVDIYKGFVPIPSPSRTSTENPSIYKRKPEYSVQVSKDVSQVNKTASIERVINQALNQSTIRDSFHASSTPTTSSIRQPVPTTSENTIDVTLLVNTPKNIRVNGQRTDPVTISTTNPRIPEETTTTTAKVSTTHNTLIKTTTGPSPLTGFLIPGGQLSDPSATPVPSYGRPSITKVLIPGPNPQLDNLHDVHVRHPKSSIHFKTHEKNTSEIQPSIPKNDTMKWYFANYNQSNIEPYIGPVQLSFSYQNQFSLPFILLSTISSIIYFI